MSSPLRQPPPTSVRERPACMCVHGQSCSSFASGHALHLIQARMAQATPSEWSDATVEAVRASGDVTLRTLDGAQVVVWGAPLGAQTIDVGTPVAFHERYHVLAVGSARYNVARLDELDA